MTRVLAAILLCLSCPPPSLAQDGRLVIVGGALAPDNAAVWGAFIAGLPDPAHDRIAVIASASAEPVASFESARAALARHGVAPERVVLIRAAVLDDPATTEDERLWRGGGNDPLEVATIGSVGGIWFTGGDQARTAALLHDAEGASTPLLLAMRQRLAQGAVIGGSSAGAAIHGDVMILRGDGLTALVEPVGEPAEAAAMEDGRLILAPGAGFFPFGLIDQHFDRQARLGRLARAVTNTKAVRMGFGIDENTALVVDLGARTAGVAGEGAVTVIDARTATSSQSPFSADGLILSLAAPGDQIDLMTGHVTPALFKTTDTLAQPFYNTAPSTAVGPALPFRRFEDALVRDLIDNGASTRLDQWSFQSDGVAVRFRFDETSTTRAFNGRDGEGQVQHAISGVRFSITPGWATFSEIQP